MDREVVQQVLTNWIAEALSPYGKLPADTSPPAWIAEQFLTWWQSEVDGELSALESALHGIDQELERLGGWQNSQLGDALHELVHAREVFSSIRQTFASGKH